MIDTDGNLHALNRHLQEREEYEARFDTCPECDGEGVCMYEEAVADFTNGGFLREVLATCERCHGAGEIEVEFDE